MATTTEPTPAAVAANDTTTSAIPARLAELLEGLPCHHCREAVRGDETIVVNVQLEYAAHVICWSMSRKIASRSREGLS